MYMCSGLNSGQTCKVWGRLEDVHPLKQLFHGKTLIFTTSSSSSSSGYQNTHAISITANCNMYLCAVRDQNQTPWPLTLIWEHYPSDSHFLFYGERSNFTTSNFRTLRQKAFLCVLGRYINPEISTIFRWSNAQLFFGKNNKKQQKIESKIPPKTYYQC